MPLSLYTVLNQQNGYKEKITITAPIQEDFVRFMANREILVTATFLADGYVYDIKKQSIMPQKGLALTGSKLAYSVKDDIIYNAVIEAVDKENLTDDVQILMYFFS